MHGRVIFEGKFISIKALLECGQISLVKYIMVRYARFDY